MPRGEDGPVDRFVVMLGLVHIHAEQLGKLRGGDDDGGCVGEPVDDRVREEVDHRPQAENAEQELEQPDQQGEQNGVGDECFAAGGGQRRECRGGHQRHDGHRACRQLSAGAEDGRHERGQERGVESEKGRQVGQLGVGHGLRDQDQRNRQAGNEVGPQTGE